MRGRAPVTPIKRICTDKIQRTTNQGAVIDGHHQQYAVGHGAMNNVKKVPGQIGTAPFAVDR